MYFKLYKFYQIVQSTTYDAHCKRIFETVVKRVKVSVRIKDNSIHSRAAMWIVSACKKKQKRGNKKKLERVENFNLHN